MGAQENHGKPPPSQVLLEWQVLLDRDERIASTGEPIEEWPVVDVRCAEQTADGRDIMSRPVAREAGRHARIQHEPHRPTLDRAWLCLSDQGLAGEFEHGDRVLARHVREV